MAPIFAKQDSIAPSCGDLSVVVISCKSAKEPAAGTRSGKQCVLCSGVAGACRLAHARGDQQPSLSFADTEESSPGIAAVPVNAHLIPVNVAVCYIWDPGQGGGGGASECHP